MSNFCIFHDASSPNMAMSRDLRSKCRKKIIFLSLYLILGKVTKFLLEKLSTSEVICEKPHGDGNPPPPPNAFRVKVEMSQLRLQENKWRSPYHSNRTSLAASNKQ